MFLVQCIMFALTAKPICHWPKHSCLSHNLVFVQANEAGVSERRAKSDVPLTDSESVDEETNVYTLNNL